MRCGGFVGIAVFACAAWTAAGARADAFDLPLQPERVSVGGELSYFSADEDSSTMLVLAPLLQAHYAWNERWSLSTDWGFITASASPEQGSADGTWRPGNPTIFALLRGSWPGVRYRVGLGGAAPLAVVERDNGQGRIQHVAYNDVQGMHGLWDIWLWAPSRGAAIARGELEADLDPELRLELAAAPALMIPARHDYTRYDISVFVPLALGFSTSKGIVRIGVRGQVVLMPNNTIDAAQFSLEPWLRVALGSAFVEARYTANLDEPLAGTRGPGIWGLHLSAGGVL